ncbi:unnamed protein product [Prunus armeniaca]
MSVLCGAAASAGNSIRSLVTLSLPFEISWISCMDACCYVIYGYRIRFRLWRFRCHLGTFFGWYVGIYTYGYLKNCIEMLAKFIHVEI